MARILFLLITTLLFCSCHPRPEKIIGIKIYDYKGDFEQLVSRWDEMGINTAFVSTTLASDKDFRRVLKSRGIKVFIIFPVFFNPEILKKDSTLYAITNTGKKASQEWVEFVCPSRKSYRRAMTDQMSQFVSTLDPDGLSIDFIREFVYWEKIYYDRDFRTIERACFCDSCLADLTGINHITIPDSCNSTSARADWIEKNFSSIWNRYRCDLITSMIRDLSEEAHRIKNEILVNVHIVPWRKDDFGGAAINIAAQDLKSLVSYTDFVSPMCYSQMLDRDPKWISAVVKDMDTHATGMVLPSIQVYPYYIDRIFNTAEFKLCLGEALNPPSCGVVFFSWPLFEKDSSRMKVVKEVIEQF
jgi:hypothetical protein